MRSLGFQADHPVEYETAVSRDLCEVECSSQAAYSRNLLGSKGIEPLEQGFAKTTVCEEFPGSCPRVVALTCIARELEILQRRLDCAAAAEACEEGDSRGVDTADGEEGCFGYKQPVGKSRSHTLSCLKTPDPVAHYNPDFSRSPNFSKLQISPPGFSW